MFVCLFQAGGSSAGDEGWVFFGPWLAGMVVTGWWLDWMTLKVFSDHNEPVICEWARW